ncbi:FAD/NAD(P)-binding protein [Pseudomonas aeruginosa]|uniref:FAD/NAD(P)-binding protein n=1 Tax=Pseudomonas aeruginosa TaxID=287 RepID=UPI003CC69E29
MEQESSTRRIVVVGGGIAGVASFIACIRFKVAARIDIVDPRGIGGGVAFSTTESVLLCNTSVETMSLLDDDSDDFLHYLQEQYVEATRDSFVPRYHVSRYIEARYTHYCGQAEAGGIGHRYIKASARSISKLRDGTYRVELDNGSAVDGSDILICTGNGAPFQPEPIRSLLERPGLHGSLYPEREVLDSLAPYSNVLVLGSRLSAIDSALLLCQAGHRVLLASPSGRLPAVRTATPRTQVRPNDKLAFEFLNLTHSRFYWHLLRRVARAAQAIHGRRLKEQVARSAHVPEMLMQEIALASRGVCDWQEVIVPFMDLAESAWKNAPVDDQRVALANCSAVIGRYLFAIPVQTARTIAGYINAGLLRIMSAQLLHVSNDQGWVVEWADDQCETFDAIVCATGFSKPQWRASRDSLEWCTEQLPSHPPTHVTPDLRVCFDGKHHPERIWTIGVASHLAAPVVNSVYQTVRQAYRICHGWRNSSTSDV